MLMTFLELKFLSKMIVLMTKIMNIETFFFNNLALGTCIKNICIGVTYSARSICIKDTNFQDFDTKSVGI